MSYTLGNQLTLSVFINDYELPLDGMATVNLLHMAESLKFKLPLMQLDVTDTSGTLDAIPIIHDATPVRIVIEAATGLTETYNFRVFDWKRQQLPSAVRFTFDGYADNPVWWLGTSTRSYYGSSTDVLRQLAQACAVPYTGVTTSDVRNWNQQGMRYCSFASYVAARAFASDNSRITMGYTLQNEILVKDVNRPDDPVATLSNKGFHDGYAYISDYVPETTSGFSNRSIGYESTLYRQSIIKPMTVPTLEFTPNTTTPQINLDIKGIIQKGQPRHSPIDVGNSNQNSERGLYQNNRYAALFSQRLHITTDYMPLPVRLLDWVNTALVQDNNTPDNSASGMYLIVSRAIIVTGTRYQERLLGERHGVNTSLTQQ